MIPNILQFLKDGAAIAASGFKRVDVDTYEKRLETCRSCEHLKGSQCDVCTCLVSIKAEFAVEKCPLSKWPGDKPVEPYVPPEEYHRRVGICESCPFRRGRRCAGCSCDLYTMARLTNSKCPKENW